VVFRNRRIAVDQKALRTHRASIAFVAALTAVLLTIALVPTASAELPIPQLALWEAHMLSFGQTHCDFLTQPHTLDELFNHIYYDAERVFYQIADYTGNSAWTTCAQRAEAVYRDQYVLPNNGTVPGYWSFTTGLRMDYQRTGDAQAKTAAILLSQNGAYAPDATPLAWTATAERSREVAYTILSYINAEALGQPKRQRRINLVNQAYGHMDEWFVDFSWPGPWQQSPQTTIRLSPFMVGLTAHALIRDWEETGDARLLPALRRAADWMWANAWIPSAQAMWYEFPDQAQPCCQASAAADDLNLLIAPLYAFLYRQTGDIKYRDQGDQLFAGGVIGAYLSGGKQFDQNYWWSFDYVTWRRGPTGPNDTTAPTVTITAPATLATVVHTVTVSATATDNVGVVGVRFKLDGANLGAEMTAAPYAVNWDTATAVNGTHTLTAVARDAAGNTATSAGVVVIVNNDILPPVSAPPSSKVVVPQALMPITVDGIMTEWSGAAVSFNGLSNGATAYLQWDATNLYVAFLVTDMQLSATRSTRDAGDLWADDTVEIYLDTLGDRATSLQPDDYQFSVNLNNTQGDLRGAGGWKDVAWNGTWMSAVSRQGTVNSHGDLDSGYVVEIVIPWAELGVTPFSGMVLGIDLVVNDSDPAGSPAFNTFDWAGITGSYARPSLWKQIQLR
jgi:hypothetical protein